VRIDNKRQLDIVRARRIPPAFILRKVNLGGWWLRSDGPISVEDHMRYGIVVWSTIAWIAICLAPYLYAVNDLITWR
jgi:hypothetical protein